MLEKKSEIKTYSVSFRQLIGLASGPHNVNFNALQYLLISLVERLGFIDEPIDLHNYRSFVKQCYDNGENNNYTATSIDCRLLGGDDRDDDENVDDENVDVVAHEKAESVSKAPPVSDATNNDGVDMTEGKDEAAANELKELESKLPLEENLSELVMDEYSSLSYIDENIAAESDTLIDSEETIKIKLDRVRESDLQSNDKRLPPLSITQSSLEMRLEIFKLDFKEELENIVQQSIEKLKQQVLMLLGELSKIPSSAVDGSPDDEKKKFLQNLKGKLQNLDTTADNNDDGEKVEALEYVELQESIHTQNASHHELSSAENLSTYSSKPKYFKFGEDEEKPTVSDYNLQQTLSKLAAMKKDVCFLFKKYDELTVVVKQERTAAFIQLIQDLKKEFEELRISCHSNVDQYNVQKNKVLKNLNSIKEIRVKIKAISDEKADITDMHLALATKANFHNLQRKVSVDDFVNMRSNMIDEICKTRQQINLAEKNIAAYVEGLLVKRHTDVMDALLQKHRTEVNHELRLLRTDLNNLHASTLECKTAVTTTQLLADRNCLSCGSSSVKNNSKDRKIAPPHARATPTFNPLVAFQVSTLRNSGDRIGYMAPEQELCSIPKPRSLLKNPQLSATRQTNARQGTLITFSSINYNKDKRSNNINNKGFKKN